MVMSLTLVFSPAALAHIVAYDGDAVVTLHIEPYDSPVAGVPEKLTFIYGTVPGTFDAHKCICKLTMTKGGRTVVQKTVSPTGSYYGELSYTFKNTGIYELQLAGAPVSASGFKPFNVSYRISVGGGPSSGAASPQKKLSPALIAAAVALPFLIAFSTLTFYRNRRR